MIFIYIAIGGAVGALSRYLVSNKIASIIGNEFPYGTLTVNITGSFLMGVIFAYLTKIMPDNTELKAFLLVGILGGFTTFSAFSLDAINLFESGNLTKLAIYIIGSVILSILALFIGLSLVRSFS